MAVVVANKGMGGLLARTTSLACGRIKKKAVAMGDGGHGQ